MYFTGRETEGPEEVKRQRIVIPSFGSFLKWSQHLQLDLTAGLPYEWRRHNHWGCHLLLPRIYINEAGIRVKLAFASRNSGHFNYTEPEGNCKDCMFIYLGRQEKSREDMDGERTLPSPESRYNYDPQWPWLESSLGLPHEWQRPNYLNIACCCLSGFLLENGAGTQTQVIQYRMKTS